MTGIFDYEIDMSRSIYLILERGFDGDLLSLMRGGHVWMLGSVDNDARAKSMWKPLADDDALKWRLSTFVGDEDIVEAFYIGVGLICDHHDEYSDDGRWDVIHVIGLPLTQVKPNEIADAVGENGIVCEVEEQGFSIRAPAAQGSDSDGR